MWTLPIQATQQTRQMAQKSNVLPLRRTLQANNRGNPAPPPPPGVVGGFDVFGNDPKIAQHAIEWLGNAFIPSGGITLTGDIPKEPKKRGGAVVATEREVTDARLEAIEARLDGRLTSIDAKLDRLADQLLAVRAESATANERSIEASARAERAAEKAESKAEDARKAAGQTFWNILGTGIAVAAVVGAIAFSIFQVYTASVDNVSGLFGKVVQGQSSEVQK